MSFFVMSGLVLQCLSFFLPFSTLYLQGGICRLHGSEIVQLNLVNIQSFDISNQSSIFLLESHQLSGRDTVRVFVLLEFGQESTVLLVFVLNLLSPAGLISFKVGDLSLKIGQESGRSLRLVELPINISLPRLEVLNNLDEFVVSADQHVVFVSHDVVLSKDSLEHSADLVKDTGFSSMMHVNFAMDALLDLLSNAHIK